MLKAIATVITLHVGVKDIVLGTVAAPIPVRGIGPNNFISGLK